MLTSARLRTAVALMPPSLPVGNSLLINLGLAQGLLSALAVTTILLPQLAHPDSLAQAQGGPLGPLSQSDGGLFHLAT